VIIWGWRARTHSLATGEFYCPHCSAKQAYDHQKLRRWFTLYFIPLIPLEALGEHITCKQCRKAWELSVLDLDPEKQQAEQLRRISADWYVALAAIASTTGTTDTHVADSVVADIASATGLQFQASDFVNSAAANRQKGVTYADALANLGTLAQDLSNSGKERFLTCVLKVLRMTTNCGPEEIALVRKLGLALGISESHVKGILLEAGLH
jgi:hypothetical protein